MLFEAQHSVWAKQWVMSTRIPEPVFIVGCSRGGTTVMHAILGNHPEFVVFPEANILYTAISDLDYRQFGTLMGRATIPRYLMGRVKNKLGYTGGFDALSVKRFLNIVGWPDLVDSMPQHSHSMRTQFEFFDHMMSVMSGGKRWVEKSPQNIFCIDYIEKYIQDARFIHVVRNGEDTVASLIDAANKYDAFKSRFGGRYGIQKAVQYYNAATRISMRKQGRSGHIVIRYEDVARKSQCAISKVENLCGIEISQEMLYFEPKKIASKSETWKVRPNKKIEPAKSKFDAIFNQDQKMYIRKNIIHADPLIPQCQGTHLDR